MTLKIEKDSAGLKTIIRLSGRLQAEHLDEIKAQLAGIGAASDWTSTALRWWTSRSFGFSMARRTQR
ncbi:MAG: hypothetical protein ACXW6J_02365 [Candidatus Binatia bacterium]